jgi:hypothetical protein
MRHTLPHPIKSFTFTPDSFVVIIAEHLFIKPDYGGKRRKALTHLVNLNWAFTLKDGLEIARGKQGRIFDVNIKHLLTLTGRRNSSALTLKTTKA